MVLSTEVKREKVKFKKRMPYGTNPRQVLILRTLFIFIVFMLLTFLLLRFRMAVMILNVILVAAVSY
jgi:hypothetical protein